MPSYAPSSHNHDDDYSPLTHTHTGSDVEFYGADGKLAMFANNRLVSGGGDARGFVAKDGSSGLRFDTADDLSVMVFNLASAVQGQYLQLGINNTWVPVSMPSYALESHNHDGTYAPASLGNDVASLWIELQALADRVAALET
jgi:hypothetical protein